MGRRRKICIKVFIVLVLYISKSIADWGTCLLGPKSSPWTEITAQHDFHSHGVFEHEVGSVPIKVDVQIKPGTQRPESNYYFPGIGSAQRDDDDNSPYGGVVFYYNEESVTLSVPNKNDGFDTGQVIYTGGNAWIGPVLQSEKSAMYRIRVWGKQHFPKPDFESQWIPMDTNTNTYKEIPHGLGTEPDYVIVQVQIQQGLFSEAVGTSMELHSNPTEWGGVIYSYNDTIVKLWSPNSGQGGIFSSADGWGDTKKSLFYKSGTVKIYAWKKLWAKDSHQDTNSPSSQLTTLTLGQTVDRKIYLMDLKIKSMDGQCKNFIFHGTGAVQNVLQNNSFGGIVYSYSDQEVRFWYPNTAQGSLLFVGQSWGQPNTQHKSNNVQIAMEIWKPYTVCPPITTALNQPATTISIKGPLITTALNQPATTIPIKGAPITTELNQPATTIPIKDTPMRNVDSTKTFSFSFTDVNVPTMLVGSGFGVAGSVLLFSIGCVIRKIFNKSETNEVKPEKIV